MTRFVLKRILTAIPVFLGITILVFALSYAASGSPVSLLLQDPMTTKEEIAMLEEQLGLNKPVYIQYLNWLHQLLQGNFGFSYRTGQTVAFMVGERVGPTLLLTVTSTLVSILIAVPLGVMSAYKPYSGWDYVSSALSFVGASLPNFFAGLLMIYFFTVKLQWLPLGGMFSTSSSKNLGDLFLHLLLPLITFSLQQIGSILRQTRSSLMEVMQDDFIRTARAKGISETRVVVRHGLRNALIPVVTVVFSMVPFIIGGAVITEQIFSWPGIGSLMVQSINARDYPVIMGITTIVAGVVLTANIVADVVYGLLDPKIRMSR
ncbi:MAG: ABC transporter permease [Eubacteriales bacterium]|nr:ABC transporter permease [Eubacteriales bacterium]